MLIGMYVFLVVSMWRMGIHLKHALPPGAKSTTKRVLYAPMQINTSQLGMMRALRQCTRVNFLQVDGVERSR
jgi:hypothetical protein